MTQAVVLTIDDEDTIRKSFRNFMEDCDYRVLEASDGRIGLEIFRREAPDLILVDLRMPEMDGLEVLEKVTRESPDTPIIVVSGTGLIGDAVEALHLGAWDYLLKPVEDLSMLLHAVEKALERARLLKENWQYKEHLEDMVRMRTEQLETANKELIETRMQVIRRLGKAAEYKDNETGRHVIRVSCYSKVLAEGLGLDPETVDLICQCSPMHDLGKIGIPDHILRKKGPLDKFEQEIVREHTAMGRRMLEPLPDEESALFCKHTTIGEDILGGSDFPLLETARKIAAFHHEHWDGSGYPYGLSGEDIPIEARIVTVADVYDALSSERSYKKPFSEEKCRKIIRELSGTFLDPAVIEVFYKNIDKIHAIKEEWKD
ncbi:MAG: response regulator [bacterium]|nr:response regulator [bacterium]